MDPCNDSASPRLFTIDEAPGAGRGVFASRDLAAGEKILTANDLCVHVLFREYRGEICYNCFGYDLGGKQPIKDATHGLAFCSQQCQITFLLESDDLCMAARAAVEKLLKTKATSNQHSDTLLEPRPSPADIEKAWAVAKTQGDLIRIARLNDPDKPAPTKSHLRALQRPLSAPVSPDVLAFLLSAAFTNYNTLKYSDPVKSTLIHALESESQPYLSAHELAEYTTSYLQLLAVLPVDLLSFVSGAKLHEIKSRETHNSFGIRSLFDDGSEFFGYGVWPSASYFNHSCGPNLVRVRKGRSWVFSAGRDIEKGEQLYISSGEVMSGTERRGLLRKTWGFECGCGRCVEERGVVG
ncbi:hypothetical protein B0T16DRAFT_438585 [Cercophora newfieldiana]|uniref:SET domain-containing protein n=1 Tax=Cercophora newfieldiana TaxID=92897 RepID=A0AA39Y2R7_9PEZI|nr:hypothetical protein B0T16DRAFT_438585 [Cercophora newfieldiana]